MDFIYSSSLRVVSSANGSPQALPATLLLDDRSEQPAGAIRQALSPDRYELTLSSH
jgi:hypothetical protein